MTNIIAVTGASGQLGRSVVSSLLEKGVPPAIIIAVVRTVEKVNYLAEKGVIVRQGGFSDINLLEQAFQGVSTVLIITGTDFGQRVTQFSTVVKAAKKSGATSVVYTSTLHAEKHMVQLTTEHKASEDAIMACGLHYTFL